MKLGVFTRDIKGSYLKLKVLLVLFVFPEGFIYLMGKNHYRVGEINFAMRSQRMRICWHHNWINKEKYLNSRSSRIAKTIAS